MTSVVAAFTEEQTQRLTGISRTQLRYWDKTEFFSPSLSFGEAGEAYGRLYSFRDIVCLRVVNALRNEAKVSLHHLRSVKDRLAHIGDDLWAKTTLYVLNRAVIFHNPESDAREEVLSRQAVLNIPLRVVSGNVEQAVRSMRERDPASVGKTEKSRGIARNQVVIAGTRIPVSSIKEFADAGYSVEAIKREYPSLTTDDIEAAIAYGVAA